MRSLARLVLAVVGGVAIASAATIQFVGVPTGVNDGVDYVTPYAINIDGSPQLVTCYDVFDNVNWGDVWQANILTLDQAAASGYFAGKLEGYKRIAWLDAQAYSNDTQQVGVQHAIWNVFGQVPVTAETARYEAAADAAALNAYSGFDFSRFRFIEQIGGVVGRAGTEQAFVFETPASVVRAAGSTSDAPLDTPEANTFALWCGPGIALAIFAYKRKSQTGWRTTAA